MGLGVNNKSGSTKHNQPMKIFALVAVAVSFILVGCGEKASEPTTPAVPSTNAVPMPPK